MKHIRNVICAAVLAVGVGAPMTFSSASSAEPTKLIFNAYLPPINATRKMGIEDFGKRIEKESKGSLKIVVPDASLAPELQQYSLLIDGVADMAFIQTNSVSQRVSLNGIADIPFNAATARSASIALWETYNKYFKKFDEYKGVVVLSTHVLPGRQFVGLKSPINTLAALDGKRIWVPGGALTNVIKPLGAVPIHTNFPKLYETVTKGLCDGLVITLGSSLSARILDHVHYNTEIPGGLGSVSFAVAISKQRWDSLTKDQQAAILRAAKGLPGRTGGAIDGVEKVARIIAGKKHIKIDDVAPTKALLDKLDPILEGQVNAWKKRAAAKGLKNPDEVLKFYRSVMAKAAASKPKSAMSK